MGEQHCTDVDLRDLKYAEVNGIPDTGEESAARSHLNGCPECQKRYGSITSDEVSEMEKHYAQFSK